MNVLKISLNYYRMRGRERDWKTKKEIGRMYRFKWNITHGNGDGDGTEHMNLK